MKAILFWCIVLSSSIMGCLARQLPEPIIPDSPLATVHTQQPTVTYTSIPTGTATPPPTATPSPTATPQPTFTPPVFYETVTIKPDCTSDEYHFSCYDPILDISYTYPLEWGVITATLGNTIPGLSIPSFAGMGYNYQFAQESATSQQSTVWQILAGGRSNDFSAPRGGWVTDFSGFGKRSTDEMCEMFSSPSLCQVIKPGVIVEFHLPQARHVCIMGSMLPPPMGFVYINLPSRRLINGFVFAYPIMPDAQEQLLYQTLGFGTNPANQRCDDELAQQQFDAQIEQLGTAIKSRSGDAELNRRVAKIIRLANSIEGQETGQ